MTGTIEQTSMPRSFSLLGGPLQWLGRRLGLVRGGTNTFTVGVALGAFLWAVAAALALAGGVAHKFFSASAIGIHVRLLVVIPLFFLCETWLYPRMTAFVTMIVRSGVVPKSALPALESEIVRTARCKDSWLAEGICLMAVGAL